MSQPVGGDFDPEAELLTAAQPGWAIMRKDNGDVLLAMQRPGLGWLGYQLEPERALQIAAGLEMKARSAKRN